MTDIPDDVMKVARGLIDAEFEDNGDRPIWGPPDQFIEIIARAILAERERCAKIADIEEARFCDPRIRDSFHSRGARDASLRIAAAIRRGDGP